MSYVQVYLLECLAKQDVDAGEKTEALCSRVASRLQHANSAVVLAAVKVIIAHLDGLPSDARREELLKKLAAPLVTLLSQRPEVQYVALRNINLILQKFPQVRGCRAGCMGAPGGPCDAGKLAAHSCKASRTAKQRRRPMWAMQALPGPHPQRVPPPIFAFVGFVVQSNKGIVRSD